MIKAIIFDWAGVLAVDGYWIWIFQNIPNAENRRDFFHEISVQVDSAEMSHDKFLEVLVRESEKPAEQIWKEIKAEIVINTEIVDFIKKLKTRYKIALLSNFTHTWLNEIITENALWELFDHHIISSEHKMIKPNADIFHKMLGILQVQPNEAIFVDDRQYNVDASNAFGIKALLYTDFETFKRGLLSFGVTT